MRHSFPCHFLRVAGLFLILILGWGSRASAVGAPPPSPPSSAPKKEVDPNAPLSPELEAKFKDYMGKLKDAKAKALDQRMKQEIDDIAKITGLDDAGKQALAAPAAKAIAVSVDDWANKIGALYRKQFVLQPTQVSQMIDQMTAQITVIAQISWYGSTAQPFTQDDWIKAVHQTLSPAQADTWDKVQADRKAEIDKQIGDTVKSGATRVHDQQMGAMLAKCREMELALKLPQDRADKLEALAKTVVEQTTEKWKKRTEDMLIAMPDAQRRQVARGQFFSGEEEDEIPDQQAAWKDGLASLLTADETAHLQTMKDARKAKRAHMLGFVMVMALDDKLNFTAAQRERFQPIADRLVKDASGLFPEGGGQQYFNFAPQTLIDMAAKAPVAEIKPILDDVQWKRWQQFVKPVVEQAPSADKVKLQVDAEPEEIEKQVSKFLADKTAKERERRLDLSLLKIEDLVRVVGLSPEAASRLQAAARGTVEEYLNRWRFFVEQQMRGQLQDVTPQNIAQHLASIQDYFFQQNLDGQGGNNPTIWDKTVKTVLTDKQHETWQKELDARAAYRGLAIGSLIMAEFDRRYQLTDDQWTKLQPLLETSIREYSPDIGRIFSPMNPTPWYMENFYMLLPFMGVPDKDLKEILTKDQLDRWTGSQEHGNAANFWQNIQQWHDQRVKQK